METGEGKILEMDAGKNRKGAMTARGQENQNLFKALAGEDCVKESPHQDNLSKLIDDDHRPRKMTMEIRH